MKNPQIRLLSPFLIGALLATGLSTASANHYASGVLTPPAVKDGSNFSRAPFPAARQFNDTKAMTSTTTESLTTVAIVTPEPVLTPTGRETVFVPVATVPVATVVTPRRNAWPFTVTAPAVKDGSNFSRAPFPASRQFDDIKAPDGEAIDQKL